MVETWGPWGLKMNIEGEKTRVLTLEFDTTKTCWERAAYIIIFEAVQSSKREKRPQSSLIHLPLKLFHSCSKRLHFQGGGIYASFLCVKHLKRGSGESRARYETFGRLSPPPLLYIPTQHFVSNFARYFVTQYLQRNFFISRLNFSKNLVNKDILVFLGCV